MNLGSFMDPDIPHFQHHALLSGAGDAYLMLHRVKKQDDYNHDKWWCRRQILSGSRARRTACQPV